MSHVSEVLFALPTSRQDAPHSWPRPVVLEHSGGWIGLKWAEGTSLYETTTVSLAWQVGVSQQAYLRTIPVSDTKSRETFTNESVPIDN